MPGGQITDLREGQITDQVAEKIFFTDGGKVLALYDQSGHETYGNTWWREYDYGGVVIEQVLHGNTFLHMLRDQFGVCDDPAVIRQSTAKQP